MRLVPAVLTFSSRVTPPEGLIIDGTFIPGNTKICAPRYTIGRRKRTTPSHPSHSLKTANRPQANNPQVETAYVNPHSFIPERWYSKPELIKDKRAFAPFGIGKLLPNPMMN
jgi:hypothetical protein